MTVKSLISALSQQEDLNFLLTNRVPRAALTRFMGWFSKIENPIVRDASIGCWRLFSDLDLSEAKKTQFTSLHDCFTRELKPDGSYVEVAPAAGSTAFRSQMAALELVRRHDEPKPADALLRHAAGPVEPAPPRPVS